MVSSAGYANLAARLQGSGTRSDLPTSPTAPLVLRDEVDAFEVPSFGEALRKSGASIHQVIANVRSQNRLGSGDFYSVYAISTRGLEGFVLRVPRCCSIGELKNRTVHPVKELHPWAARDNVGVALAVLHDEQLPLPKVEVQRRVAGRPCWEYYRTLDSAISGIKWMLAESGPRQFPQVLRALRMDPENRELMRNYDAFQRCYADYVKALAQLHPSAYDEVAQMMAEGARLGVSLDLNHANNILLVRVEEDPLRKGRFGLVDVEAQRPRTQGDRPVNMTSFKDALLLSSCRSWKDSHRGAIIHDPELRPGFVKDFQTVISKCQSAAQRWPIFLSP